MASGSASSSSVPLRRRGLISCLHSPTCLPEGAGDAPTDRNVEPPLPDQDLPQAIYDLIVPFYEKAFHRLPCETMPDLVGRLTAGGLCLGLLDPVSNIILNTLALLPEDAAAAAAAAASSSPPAGKRSKRLVRNAFPKSKRGAYAWHEVATRSYHSLVGFLVAYFGCLTNKQAIRYLYRANANLPLAVMLIQYDLYAQVKEPLDPDSERTRAALKWAATRAGHPSPSTLAQVMTVRLKGADFHLLKKQFSADGTPPIMAKDAEAIYNMVTRPPYVTGISHAIDELSFHVGHNNLDAVRAKTKAIPTTEDTWVTNTTYSFHGRHSISSLQSGLSDKLEDCLKKTALQAILLKVPCGDDCDYLQSLKMYLHGMIHNFYINALKLLPTPSGPLMRSFLLAGHCYGSMDPVSNIIVNSIWYFRHGCLLPKSEHKKMTNYIDIFDPVALLPVQAYSLEGLTKLATFVDPQFLVADSTLETLCSAKCNIVDMLPSSTGRLEKNSFHEAAMAGKHLLPLQLGELHQQLLLMPFERNKLLSCITRARASHTVLLLDEMTPVLEAVVRRSTDQAPVPGKAPRLSVEALRMVSNKRSEYEQNRRWFRSQIEQVLKDYTSKHFWGPKYKLDIIVGVEESSEGPPRFGRHYHVNFTATSDLKLERTLFFAEFWVSSEPKPNFCCPLPYLSVARCYYGVHTSRKIVYPDRSEYIMHDITQYGTCCVHDLLEMDLIYFSSKRDVQLAKYLNQVASSEQVPEHPSGWARPKKARRSKTRPGLARPSGDCF
ncbi:hypothetical protein ACQ4PT_007139 [Festuca glaucescens]